MPRLRKVPAYRHHKPTNQAVVTIAGRDRYLGTFGSPASHLAYQRLIQEWTAEARPEELTSAGLSIDDLMARYWSFAEGYYRRNEQPTGELANIRYALRPLHELYGNTPASEFSPKGLKAIQQLLIGQGLCRNVINRRVCKIKRMFKWAVSEEILPVQVYEGLATVEGLKKYRTAARETTPVGPVSDDVVDKTLPYLPPVVQDMVRIQRLVGCRPGELCALRPQDVDRTTLPWVYRPAEHKTEHLDQQRAIVIGPRAQEILAPYLHRAPDSYCFSPQDSERERKAALRARRKTPVQPSQRDRSRAAARRRPGPRYTRQALLVAIRRACDRAGVPPWSPNRLRHAAATQIHNEFSLEIAQAVLGHRRPDTTLLYVEQQMRRAKTAMLAIG